VAKAKTGGVDLYFLGDSITRRWGALDYPDFLAHFQKAFFGWNAGNFGWGADRTEHILWRLENGELEGVDPKVIVLLAGTNNVGKEPGNDASVADITRGLTAIVESCRKKAPAATIVLTAIFPRNDNIAPRSRRVRARLAGPAARMVSSRPSAWKREIEMGGADIAGKAAMTNCPGRPASRAGSSVSNRSVTTSAVSCLMAATRVGTHGSSLAGGLSTIGAG